MIPKPLDAILVAMEPRAEGWLWWSVVVGAIVVVLLLLTLLRRRFIRPLPRSPSDTTDAWAEAGRRLPVPPPESTRDAGRGEEESP